MISININELSDIDFPIRENVVNPAKDSSEESFFWGASGSNMKDMYIMAGRKMIHTSIAGVEHLRIDGPTMYMVIEQVNAKLSKQILPPMVMKTLLFISTMYLSQHSRTVSIKLSDLVYCLGFADEKSPTKSQIDKTRREFLNSLEYLYHMSVHFDAAKFTIGQKNVVRENYEIRILSSKWGDFPVSVNEKNKFVNGVITIRLTEDFEEILKNSPLFKFPKEILALSGKNIYVFSLATYFAILHSMKKNHSDDPQRDKSQCIRISSILKQIGLPSIEDVRNNGGSWRRSIKEPLETALEGLVAGQYILFWHYGRPINGTTDIPENPPEESLDFTSYEEWVETLLWFEPVHKISYSEKLQLPCNIA